NDHELIWSCLDVLRDDPCCRFTYGVTLDGANLRIWFFSRSHELVSSPFSSKTIRSRCPAYRRRLTLIVGNLYHNSNISFLSLCDPGTTRI
ncbi:hypothetical protein B0H16DRAFT_1314665, partial [Mycena metata]